MADLISPLWLLALVPLLPFVWWLHRFRVQGVRIEVSALLLWRGLPGAAQGGSLSDHPDPAWRRRALFAGLLVLLLSGPIWREADPVLTIWFDDSLSMKVREQDGPRWRLGLERLYQALEEAGQRPLELRPLHRPGASHRLHPGEGPAAIRSRVAEWLARPEDERSLPSLPLDSGEHWLVTDGAGGGLQDWVADAGIAKVIPVGSRTENSAITRFGLRPSLAEPSSFEAVLSASNMGSRPVVRRMTLHSDGVPQADWELTIPPGATLSRWFAAEFTGTQVLEASLTGPENGDPDPLPEDDSLVLKLPGTYWRLPLKLYGSCPPALQQLIAGIPALDTAVTAGIEPRLTIACSDTVEIPDGRTVIRLHQPPDPILLPGAPVWQPGAGSLQRLALPAGLFRVDPGASGNTGEAMLTLGGATLISRHTGSADIDLWFDMHHAPLLSRPEFPVLIAGIMESALGHRLLDEIHFTGRDPTASRIVPKNLPTAASATEQREVIGAFDPSGWLILAAIGFLLFELWHYRVRPRSLPDLVGQTHAGETG